MYVNENGKISLQPCPACGLTHCDCVTETSIPKIAASIVRNYPESEWESRVNKVIRGEMVEDDGTVIETAEYRTNLHRQAIRSWLSDYKNDKLDTRAFLDKYKL